METQLVNRSEWITIKEAAALSGFSEARIRRMARLGRLETRKIAASLLVKRGSISRRAEDDRRSIKRRSPECSRAEAMPADYDPLIAGAFDLSAEERRARNERLREALARWEREETLDRLPRALRAPSVQFGRPNPEP